MTQLRFSLFARFASILFLSAVPVMAQQRPDTPKGAAPMDPAMHMDAPPQANSVRHPTAHAGATTKKGKQTPKEGGALAERPITEPTVPPVDEGEAMHMHMHAIEHVAPHLPEIGMSKSAVAGEGPVYTLEDLEQKAVSHNPTLSQAKEDIDAARGIRRQVGLYPNPTVGYYGDEIRGGAYRSGKEGFFVDQPIILGGKLGLNRKIEDESIHQSEAAREAQRYRVRNATREAYYRVLTAQELLHLKRDLAGIAHQTTLYMQELGNTGQADETEILRTEVREQQMLIGVGVRENMLHRAWLELASVVGDPELAMGTVRGDIEALPPEPDEKKLLDELLTQSPAVQYTRAGVTKAEAALKRARRDPIPDITAKGGLSQDNEPLFTPESRVGLVGFAEIGLQLHVFDRNQGNVDADLAELEHARQELTRVQLSLRHREASVVDDYRNARLIATRYRDEVLPRTRRAYELMTKQYGLMDASFSRVLNLQRELYQSTAEYLQALEDAHTRYVVLDGFLYSDGLDAPGATEPAMSPGGGVAMPMSGSPSAMSYESSPEGGSR